MAEEKMEVPVQVRIQGVLYLVAGLINLVFMWWFAGTVISLVGGTVMMTCTAIITAGMCPIGALCYYCGLGSFLLVPFGLVEIVIGILLLAAPEAIKPGVRIIPFLCFTSILVGDLVSPVMGLIAIGLNFSAPVQEWVSPE